MDRSGQRAEVTRFLDAWFAVRQYIQATNFNRFQGAGLSATQFMTLNLLPGDGAGLAIGDLARRMNLKPATVAKTVDSLEARNLLTRIRKPADKRVVHVCITAAGAELQNAANGSFRAQIESVFEAMDSGERSGLVLGLESLVRAVEQHSVTDQTANQPATPVGRRDGVVREMRSLRRSPQK